MDASTKRCSSCGITQEIDAFSRDRTRKDGRQSYCKRCHSAKRRTRAPLTPEQRIEHRRAMQRRWAQAHPDRIRAKYERGKERWRDIRRAAQARYYERHREEILARQRAKRQRRREEDAGSPPQRPETR